MQPGLWKHLPDSSDEPETHENSPHSVCLDPPQRMFPPYVLRKLYQLCL